MPDMSSANIIHYLDRLDRDTSADDVEVLNELRASLIALLADSGGDTSAIRRELEDRDVQGGGLSLRGGEFITRGGELRFDGVALRDSLGEGGADGVRVRNFESGT